MAILLIINLVKTHSNQAAESGELAFAEAIHPPVRLPAALNGFTLWNWILVFYMAAGFGYPILQFFILDIQNAVAWGW